MESNSEVEREEPFAELPQVRKGRPTGNSDSAQCCRRAAQEISDDKIKVAELKLENLRKLEADKIATKAIYVLVRVT